MIDLLLVNAHDGSGIEWSLGDVHCVGDSPKDVSSGVGEWLNRTTASHLLFWDARLGSPDPAVIGDLARGRFDVYHAGLQLGLTGMPRLLDFVEPIWLLTLDAPADLESTSWRLSFCAALIRTEVVRQMGEPAASFESLEAAGLEFGHRLLRSGVFIRYSPRLLAGRSQTSVGLSALDELRFVLFRYGRRWMWWAFWRAVMTGSPAGEFARSVWRLRHTPAPPDPPPFARTRVTRSDDIERFQKRVSILIPTLLRYPYLKNELNQLRFQTVKPKDILICDQTPQAEREPALRSQYPDLPIKVFPQETLGQSTGWNKAIEESEGEFVLLLGDDADRIQPDFLEGFLRSQEEFGVDVVGCAVEDREFGLPKSSTFLRMADTLPIALIDKRILERSGLYDYAFDRGARADADLAVRIHRAGGFLIIDPTIHLVHLRAPLGGLRAHNARVVTQASARKRILHRYVPSRTEIYLTLRHFGEDRLRELILQRLASSFVVDGPRWFKLLRVVTTVLVFPQTFWVLMRNVSDARGLLREFPRIPQLRQVARS